MNRRELFTLVPLLLIILMVGVYPLSMLHLQDHSIQALIDHVTEVSPSSIADSP
jgi:NADH:ubiquinone oxidoreductase subunit 4 (subunit M)